MVLANTNNLFQRRCVMKTILVLLSLSLGSFANAYLMSIGDDRPLSIGDNRPPVKETSCNIEIYKDCINKPGAQSVSDYYLPGLFRKKAEDAHAQICEARNYWEEIRRNPDRFQKAKAENELIKLERLETALNNQLYRLGNRTREEIKDIKEKEPSDFFDRITNLIVEDELNGWETFLDVQSYSSCPIYTEEDNERYSYETNLQN